MQAVAVNHLVGQTLGSCRIEQLLGQGRLSAVYLARQSAQQRPVAVTTFLIPETCSAQARERFLARFQREASALVSLDHPHILPIYEYGEQYGYPYLVTPYATDGSLASMLKRQGRFAPGVLLDAVEQISAALEYAHSHGVVHGTLKPANVLFSEEQRLQVAGFSLVRILEMRGIEQSSSPYAHLLNIAGTFLGSPEYIAPECVQGQPADARSDIYAFGILLFELLSGHPPFTGSNPTETAMMHIQQPLPSLRTLCPDISPALEAVVNQALARDPAQRFQRVQELATAFAQALGGEKRTFAASAINTAASLQAGTQLSGKATSAGKWQLVPPVMTGHLPVVKSAPASSTQESAAQAAPSLQKAKAMPVPLPARMPSVASVAPIPSAAPVLSPEDLDAMAIDPFESWSKTFTGQLPSQGPAALANTQGMVGTYGPPRRLNSRQQRMSRRKVVAAIAAGGLVAGVLGFGGLSLAHVLENASHSSTANVGPGTVATKGSTPAPASTPTQGHAASTPTPTQAKPTPKPTTATKPTPTPTHAKPTPTQPPPTPTPSHTGTVIGSTSMGTNSAKNFNDPHNGRNSILIHLPNTNFVAYDVACTHAGVPVYYDGGSHQLVCPAHGARFDPANGGQVLTGPTSTPLPGVTIHVNADGTITA